MNDALTVHEVDGRHQLAHDLAGLHLGETCLAAYAVE